MNNDVAAVLSCHKVWKVYGSNQLRARAHLSSQAAPSDVRKALVADGFFCAVSDVSLDVRKGEILMIMGLSGSGKSTLLRCLSRLVEPTTGQILLDGQDLLRVSDRELMRIRRAKIGMVFQNFGLLPHLDVLDNVTFPLRVQGMAKAQRIERGRQLLELVHLSDRAGHYPHQLSGGQQQRVGIARSLATDPDLWFLDEPFSALDPLIRRQMQDEFLRLQSQLGKTIVFVTHDFSEAARLGDRIAIMRDGQLVQVGSAAEIILGPANSYVSDFTADVPMLRVIKAGQVMKPLPPRGSGEKRRPIISASASLGEALPLFLGGAAEIGVQGPESAELGVITRERFEDLVASARPASI